MRVTIALVLSLLLLEPQPVAGQAPTSTHHVRFTTEEGSWLSFDVSPDGRWIVFDLLGQLWRLPITGGVAQPLTNAVRDSAELLDPVYAPDGLSLIAHGEHGGRLGIFQINSAGSGIRWIAPDTVDGFFGHSIPSPSWSADGRSMLHSKREPNGISALVEIDLATRSQRVVPIGGVDGIHRDGAIYTADESEIFFNTRKGGSGIVPQAGRIWRVPANGGTAHPVTPPAVLARMPAPSPDGRRIAYFVIDSTNHAQVWLQPLADSVGTPLTADRDVTPTRIRWLGPDTLLYVESGRLWRLDVRTRARQAIPFKATVDFTRAVANLPPVRFSAPGERVTARGGAGTAVAPDGRAFAQISLNRLWVIGTDAATPAAREIAVVPPTAGAPAWSPHGREIVWSAGPFGAEDLFVTDTLTRSTRRVTELPGRELAPSWSPDGGRLLFVHVGPDTAGRMVWTRRVTAVRAEVVRSVDEATSLGPANGAGHQWSPNGDLVLGVGPPGNPVERPMTLVSSAGSTRRPVRGLPPDGHLVSWLNGDTLVFTANSRLWRAPFNVAEGIVGPATPISGETAGNLAASRRGDLLYVSVDGFRLRRRGEPVRHLGWPLRYNVPTPRPLVITNVRIIDGTGTPASEPRDIVIERGRITRITPAGRAVIPRDAEIVPAKGRTAIPGLIDLHCHASRPAQLRGALYFGVTTCRSLGGSAGIVEARDVVAAGLTQGPRMTTGLAVHTDWPFGGDGVSVEPEADPDHLERALDWIPAFGLELVKIRSMYQWASQMRVIKAAHARGARVTGHCAYPMALIAAGIDSKEHLGTQCTVRDGGTWYDDLIQLYARSGTPVVPTLSLFTHGQRLRGAPAPFPPEVEPLFGSFEREFLAQSLSFGNVTAATGGNVVRMVDAARKLHRAGVQLGTGPDFELPGGVHYELEALTEASLSPLEAIRAATTVSARIMGADGELGQIAPGFLGDIVILEADPVQDIRNTRRIWRVVQGGRVIDRRELVARHWEADGLPR